MPAMPVRIRHAVVLLGALIAACSDPAPTQPDGGVEGIPAGRLIGVLSYVDASGATVPAVGARVGIEGGANGALATADGSFRLDGLPAGRVRLRAKHTIEGRELWLVHAVTLPTTTGLDAGALVLRAKAVVSGHVRNDGVGVAHARVVIEGVGTAVTDESGAWSLQVPAGEWVIAAAHEAFGELRVTERRTVLVEADLTYDIDVSEGDLLTAHVAGQLQTREGPVAGATITLLDEQGARVAEAAATGLDGSFAIDVPAGIYTAVARRGPTTTTFGPIIAAGVTEGLALVLGPDNDCDADGTLDGVDLDDDEDGTPDETEAEPCRCDPTGSADADANGVCDGVQAPVVDGRAPELAALPTTPADGATDVARTVVPSVTFSEGIKVDSITDRVRLVEADSSLPIVGTASVSGAAVLFTPAAALDASTTYRFEIDAGITDAAGNALRTAVRISFTTAAELDATPPAPLSSGGLVPANGAIGVLEHDSVAVIFDEEMAPGSATFALVEVSNSAPVSGRTTVEGNAVRFEPAAALSSSTEYRATLAGTVTDLAGNELGSEVTWTFTVRDYRPPAVTFESLVPASGATGVSADVEPEVSFDEVITAGSIAVVALPSTAIAGETVRVGNSVTFVPNAPLPYATSFQVTVSGVADAAGNTIATPLVWAFQTGAAPTPPQVVSISPHDGGPRVEVDRPIRVVFSVPMDASATTSIELRDASGLVVGTATYVDAERAVVFTPSAFLAESTTYTVTVKTTARSATGIALPSAVTSTFTTDVRLLAMDAGNGVCGIRTDRTLWCSGPNAYGQLGTGNTTSSNVPVPVADTEHDVDGLPDTDWASVSSGRTHTCAIKQDGSLWCWGNNDSGQLGLGYIDTLKVTTPQRVGTASWRTVEANSAGTTCAIRSDRTLWCWGRNDAGSAGISPAGGQTGDPTQIDPGTKWNVVSLANDVGCAIRQDGTLWCWGQNNNGATGIENGGAPVVPPTKVGTDTDWFAVASNSTATCGLRGAGTLWCWGSNADGMVGVPGAPSGTTAVNVQPAVADWTSVSTMYDTLCATRANGSAWCWGSGASYEIGDGAGVNRDEPTRVAGDLSFVDVRGGNAFNCGLTTGGHARCWGYGVDGETGTGGMGVLVGRPAQVGKETNWARVAAGGSTTCATKTNGSLWCWGENRQGSLGDGSAAAFRPVPVAIGPSTGWAEPTGGGADFVCARRSDGTLWCWGTNVTGQLGTAPTSIQQSNVPVAIGAASNWQAMWAGEAGAFGLNANGQLFGWGRNASGALGIGNTSMRATPIQVSTTLRIGAVGLRHACAIDVDGQLFCAGTGALGNGTFNGAALFVQESTLSTGWTDVAASNAASCGINGGAISCWGDNGSSELGDGTTDMRASPTPVSGEETPNRDWSLVRGGRTLHFCAIKTGGDLYCWGANYSGELGLGHTTNTPMPAFVASDFADVAPSMGHTCGVKTDGTLWCWGYNWNGILGLAESWATTPTPVELSAD